MTTTGYPLDTVKVRIQTMQHAAGGQPAMGVFSCFSLHHNMLCILVSLCNSNPAVLVLANSLLNSSNSLYLRSNGTYFVVEFLLKINFLKPCHIGTWGILRQTVRNEGFFALYRGMSAPVMSTYPMYALCFWGYGVGKNLFAKEDTFTVCGHSWTRAITYVFVWDILVRIQPSFVCRSH